MRTSYLSSIVFALLAGFSVAANAAPADGAPPAPVAPASASAEQGAKININAATAETLHKELAGIGAAKAAAIVAYREENGAFTSIDELIEVKGIGKALLDRNRDRLALD